MRNRLLTFVVAIVVLSGAMTLNPTPAVAQRGGRGAPAPPPEPGPFDRLSDGTPDLNGIWGVRGGLGNITPNIAEVGGAAVAGAGGANDHGCARDRHRDPACPECPRALQARCDAVDDRGGRYDADPGGQDRIE